MSVLDIFVGIVLFAAGYTASVYSWPTLRGWWVGAEVEIERLKKAIEVLRGN